MIGWECDLPQTSWVTAFTPTSSLPREKRKSKQRFLIFRTAVLLRKALVRLEIKFPSKFDLSNWSDWFILNSKILGKNIIILADFIIIIWTNLNKVSVTTQNLPKPLFSFFYFIFILFFHTKMSNILTWNFISILFII